MQQAPRRIVTGHDVDGNAIISIDDHCITVGRSPAQPDLRVYEMWETSGMPVLLGNDPDPTHHSFRIQPKTNGLVVRVADIPPDTPDIMGSDAAKRYFESLGAGDASTSTTESKPPHPFMHRTETIDFGILIEGTFTLILDNTEVTLRPGDVVVQRGTNHAWSNRSGSVARIAFILLDGKYEEELDSRFRNRAGH